MSMPNSERIVDSDSGVKEEAWMDGLSEFARVE
jgi:hypothetical protein